MNCGSCLFTNAKVVALNDQEVCPECKADYSRAATHEEMQAQAAAAKPIVFSAGREIQPAPKRAASTGQAIANVEVEDGDDALPVIMTYSSVIAYLVENNHITEKTAIGAMAASKIFGKGVASGLAASGRISVSGIRRGSKYWFPKLQPATTDATETPAEPTTEVEAT